MSTAVNDHTRIDSVSTHVLLHGMLRCRGGDYLLEERPRPAPWQAGRIWRVDVADDAPIDLVPFVDHVIEVDAAPYYIADHHYMVMRIASVQPG